MKTSSFKTAPLLAACLVVCALGGCAAPKSGYLSADRQPSPVPEAESGKLTAANARSTYMDLVRQMQDKGLWFASLAHIDALEQQWGNGPDTTLARADALRMTEQPQAAAVLYRKLLNTPAAAAAYRGLGLTAAAASDYAAAVQNLEQAQRLAPTDPALLSDLGYAYLKAGRIADARVPAMQAAQLDAGNPRVLANVALFLLADGQPERAQAVMSDQRVPQALREAILREAASLRGGNAQPAQRQQEQAGADAPLQLKTTAWTTLLDQRRLQPSTSN